MQIVGITDSVDSGRSANYGYDGLARLSTALTTGSVTYPQWGLSWGYDRYGNRLNQTLTAGSGYSGSVTVDATTNRIVQTTGTTYAYDANGNMTNDNLNTISYDAENRAVTSSGTLGAGTYTYDGNGLRVKKVAGSTTTVYIFSGSKVIAEYDNGALPTAPTREYIYGGGALLAKIDSSGTKYYHQDHLSNRLVTDSSGNTYAQMGHFPFGDPWYNATNDKLYFTTYERDSESGNDFAMARYYTWRIGRFLSLDPLTGSTGDPQSLNRYPYVENDPIDHVDPKGQYQILASNGCYYEGIDFSVDGEYEGTDFYLLACPRPPRDPNGGGNTSGSLFSRFLNLDVCIQNNAKNFSIGGVINLTTGFDPPFLGNQVTDTAIFLTGQAGLVDTASGAAGLGKEAFQALNKPIMTNGPNSLTTLVAQRGSPQPVLGSGTNYSTTFLGKVGKVAGKATAIVDLGLSGALVVDCLAGKVK